MRPAGADLLAVAATPSSQKVAAAPRRAEWLFEQHGPAKAHGETKDRTITVTVKTPGTEPWHVQFNHPGLALDAGESYAVTFRAKSEPPRTISVNLGQTREPYKVFASQGVALTPEWQDVIGEGSLGPQEPATPPAQPV